MDRTRAVGLGIGAALTLSLPIVGYFEGRELISYLDPVRIPTICGGITQIDGKPVRLGMTATDEQCDELERYELGKAITAVDALTYPTVLGDFQRAAFGSFVYNVGPTKFSTSTMRRKILAGDIIGACNELPRWVYAKGKKLNGLVKRRAAERKLCLTGL